MKLLFNKIFLLSLLILTGCSKSDDDSNVIDNTPSINSIQVLVSSAEVTVGTTILLLYLIIQVKTQQVKQNFMLMELKYQVHLILLMILALTKYMLNTRILKAKRRTLLLIQHPLNINNMY